MGKVNIVEKNGKKYIDEEEILCEYECVSTFVIQAFYKDEFAPTHYDLAGDTIKGGMFEYTIKLNIINNSLHD